jgi:Tfp pilus assembly protein PilW
MKIAAELGKRGAYTLVELMVSLSVGAMILIAVAAGVVALQTLFVATDQYYMATSDQTRVLDFIAMDLRSAMSATVSNQAQTLTLTFPDYIDYTQNPPVPRSPTLSATGTVIYGSSSSQPTVAYTITGAAPNQVIQRTLTTSTGSVTTTTLTAAAANYQMSFFTPTNPGSLTPFSLGGIGQPSSLTALITFAPRFNRLNLTTSRQGATASMTMTMRNHL